MRSTKLGDLIGWRGFVDDGVVELWDGSLMTVLALRASDVALSPKIDRLDLSKRVGDLFASLGARWTWHLEGQNTRLTAYQATEWETLVGATVDAERRAMCTKEGVQYETRFYLTLTQAPRVGAVVGRMLTTGDETDRALTGFHRTVADVRKSLSGLVSVYSMVSNNPADPDGINDKMATFLKSTVSTRPHRVRAVEHELLCDSLPDQRFRRGFKLSKLGDDYITVLTLGGFPRHTTPQLLAGLSRLAFEFRWVTRSIGLSKQEARDLLRKREDAAIGAAVSFKDAALKRYDAYKNKGGGSARSGIPDRLDQNELSRASEAGAAQANLSKENYVSITGIFVVWDKNATVCEDNCQTLMQVLQDAQLTVRRESLDPVEPWLMSLPGNRWTVRRTHVVSARNLADLLPTTSTFRGKPHDAQLAKTTGVRRAWLYTADPETYRLTTDEKGGAAHTVIFGRTGKGGKSTLANHLALQFGWPGSQIISLSVGRSELGPCLMSNGAVYELGTPSGTPLQPLAYVDDADEALTASEWLQFCVTSLGEVVTVERRAALADVVKIIAAEPHRLRTMTGCVNYLRNRLPELARVLEPFTHYGMYGHVFDGDSAASWDWRRWTMIDIARLRDMNPQASAPALANVLYRVSKRFTGKPSLVIADEVPDWAHLPGLEPWLARINDTERKRNVRALYVAQTPGQLAKFPQLFTSMKTSIVSKIYGPDPNAKAQSDEYAQFGATSEYVDCIKDLDIGEYLHATGRGARKFALKAGPIALALTTLSSAEDQGLLADLRAKGCDGDEMMREVLKRKGLEARARKLGVWNSTAITAVAAE